MTKDFISDAIQLYKEAGHLFRENKRIAEEAVIHFRERAAQMQKTSDLTGSWVETASRNASEIGRRLEQIIALGEEHSEVREHKVYALAHRNLGLYIARRFEPFHEPFPTYLDEVARHLNTALSLGLKRDRKIARTLGAAYYQSGKFKEAVEPLKESIESNPKDGVARYQLCLTYLCLHKRQKAREQYDVLKQNPSGPNYHLVKILEPMMERSVKQVDEAEQEELKRKLKNFRRARQ